jgi:hypothetical protein
MRRYQIYLDPQSVSVIDDVADALNISRSQVVRDAVEAVASRYREVIAVLWARTTKKNPLLELCGIDKGDVEGSLAENHDQIYFRD